MSTVLAPCNRCGTEVLADTGRPVEGRDSGFREMAPYGFVCVPCGTGQVPAGEVLLQRILLAKHATESEYGPQDWLDWDAMIFNAGNPHA